MVRSKKGGGRGGGRINRTEGKNVTSSSTKRKKGNARLLREKERGGGRIANAERGGGGSL